MKQLLFLLLFPCLAMAQYQGNGNQKITLGEQTTADGLVYRGVANDTNVITPFSDTSAYIILDTVNNRFYNYNRSTNVWSVAGGGVSVTSFSAGTTGLTPSSATTGAVTLGGTLAVTNGGTGENMSSLPNNYLVRKNSSGIFDTANVYEANGNIGINVIPSAWGSQFKAIESGDNNNQSAVTFNTGANGLNFFANAFFDGSNTKYKYNGFATRFVTADGKYEYYNTPSGVSGNNITWTEVMTIDASGNLGINQANPTEKLHVVGNARISGLANAANPVNVQVDVNGVLIRTSSIDIKEDVQNLPYGLNEVMLLQPSKFSYIDKYKYGEGYDIGFIAQDVNNVIPEAVGTGIESDIFMDSVKLIPVLTKAIQEQQSLIKALEQRILNLENK